MGLGLRHGVLGERTVALGGDVGHEACGGCVFHVFQTLAGHAQGGRVGTLVLGPGFVQALGHGFAFGEDFLSPGQQRAVAAVVFEQGEARLTATLGHGVPVGRLGSVDLGGVARAVGQQAVQQEDVEKADGFGGDADGAEGVEVHQPHFDVLDPAGGQGGQRPFTLADGLLGADGAVELVFDLQQGGGELTVLAVVPDADLLVGGPGRSEGVVERLGVTLEAVVAGADAGLCLALVAQRPHAQRGGVWQAQGVPAEGLEDVGHALGKAALHQRRGAEQQKQQP